MLRALEIIFSIYFFTHIPITLLIDSQAIFPRSYYPSQVTNLIVTVRILVIKLNHNVFWSY